VEPPYRSALRELGPLLIMAAVVTVVEYFGVLGVGSTRPSAAIWTLAIVLAGARVQRHGGPLGQAWSAAWRIALAIVLINIVGLICAWNFSGQVPPEFAKIPPMPPGQSMASLIVQVGWGWVFVGFLAAVTLTIVSVIAGLALWLEAAVGYAIARLLGGPVPSVQNW
jgi:hypothetical protein